MMAVGGAATNVAGGVIGYLLSMSDRQAAEALIKQSLDEAGNISLPVLNKLVAQQVGPTEFQKIQTDPALKAAQYQALNKLQEVSDGGGFTAEDKATLNKVTNRNARMAGSRNANATEGMEARGVAGSGAEFAMKQANNASANEADNQQGLDIAGMAQKRALDAILARGNMAGDMRGQDFGEKAKAAQAQDAINEYNANAKSRADQYNAGLNQQNYDNQMGLSSYKAGVRNQQANAYYNSANAKQSMVSGAASGAAKAVQTGATDQAYEDWKKKQGQTGGV